MKHVLVETLEQHQSRRFTLFYVNFEQVSYVSSGTSSAISPD